MLRIAHCLDSWLRDGGNVVNPTHRPHFSLQKHSFSASGSHFCYRLSEPQGLVWPEKLGKFKKCVHLIGSQTRDLPACSISTLITTLPRTPSKLKYWIKFTDTLLSRQIT
jgi:hypothetical protein